MKSLFYFAGCLFLAGALSLSCSDDGGDDIIDDIVNGSGSESGNGSGSESGNGSSSGSESSGIVLDSGTQTDQVVYADEESAADEGIKFTTQGSWTAEVEDITAKSTESSTVAWLTLSQYSGDAAGDYTIAVALKKNFTGSSRKAEIHIVCGDTEIVITVEQKAEKEDGVKLKRVKSAGLAVDYGDGSGDANTYTYSYDDQGRVASVVNYNVSSSTSYTDTETETYTFDYSIADEITVDMTLESSYDDGVETGKYVLTLNDQGNVVNIKFPDDYGEPDTKVGYTDDGRLEKLLSEESGNSDSGGDWSETYSYTDGLLTKVEYYYEYFTETRVKEFSVDELYPNRYPATGTNIDFNAFVLTAGDFSIGERNFDVILYQIGLLGKGSDCLMQIINIDESKVDFSYEFDEDDYVTKFSYEDPYETGTHNYTVTYE